MKSLSRFQTPLRRLLSSSSPIVDGTLTLAAARRLDPVEDSPVYRRSMLRRPPVENWRRLHRNSCSFIGTVVRPVIRNTGDNPTSSSYTLLEVKSTPRNMGSSTFRILLSMRDEISEICLRHLQPNDYIYVSGPLGSYEKVDLSGKRKVFYKVLVMDLNFVRCNDPNQIALKPASSGAGESTSSKGSLDSEEKFRARLRLWQVFFANVYEWWDNRKEKREGKLNPNYPDFKHKDTKECLWLHPDDPPWVRKQLQLYDSKMAGCSRSRSQLDTFGSKLGDFDLDF
ncbi:protein OSB1, mitochondrial-like isoform X1 [Iris pallida]|uniref:Protein OSB1, mitochondrial-like isoform X1 n=1 Tax=Iris pallida TaxID=29817 RepID=A0AAX6I437_IRIPA|nr:protein OSB1, mitochondrial-like isoform X1 [Iris pallida]